MGTLSQTGRRHNSCIQHSSFTDDRNPDIKQTNQFPKKYTKVCGLWIITAICGSFLKLLPHIVPESIYNIYCGIKISWPKPVLTWLCTVSLYNATSCRHSLDVKNLNGLHRALTSNLLNTSGRKQNIHFTYYFTAKGVLNPDWSL